MSAAAHWTRPLADGRIEFHMRIGSEKASGSAPRDFYDELRRGFEGLHGKLPAAESRPARIAA